MDSFCTKPGLAFVPADPSGDHLVELLREQVASAGAAVLLNEGIRDAFSRSRDRLEQAGVTVWARSDADPTPGFTVVPALLEIDLAGLSAEMAEECFGPLMVVVRYRDVADLGEALARVPGSLTSSIHAGTGDDPDVVRGLVERLAARAGRVVFKQVPHRGPGLVGPAPRWSLALDQCGAQLGRSHLDPALPSAPGLAGRAGLDPPEELRDGPSPIPRRVDGRLELGVGPAQAG